MKMNNKGFSLVELIVVIAIMAILVGVLAPSVVGQVEKSRYSKDVQALDSLASSMATAITEELTKSAGKVTKGDTGMSITTGSPAYITVSSSSSDSWVSAADQYCGGTGKVELNSDTFKGGNTGFKIEIDSAYRVIITYTDNAGTTATIKK